MPQSVVTLSYSGKRLSAEFLLDVPNTRLGENIQNFFFFFAKGRMRGKKEGKGKKNRSLSERYYCGMISEDLNCASI